MPLNRFKFRKLNNFILVACILSLHYSASAIVTKMSQQTLNSIQSWQCRANSEQGKQFAKESLVHAKKSCVEFLTNQKELVEPLLRAASFEGTQFSQICFLDGYRTEVTNSIVDIQKNCVSESSKNFSAGIASGHLACRLAPVDALTPEFSIQTFKLAPYNHNSNVEKVEIIFPVRSEGWARQLTVSQSSGFLLGCLLGERDLFLGVASPYIDTSGSIKWGDAGKEIGAVYGKSHCPLNRSNFSVVVEALTGSKEGPSFDSAFGGFNQGYQSHCQISE